MIQAAQKARLRKNITLNSLLQSRETPTILSPTQRLSGTISILTSLNHFS